MGHSVLARGECDGVAPASELVHDGLVVLALGWAGNETGLG